MNYKILGGITTFQKSFSNLNIILPNINLEGRGKEEEGKRKGKGERRGLLPP